MHYNCIVSLCTPVDQSTLRAKLIHLGRIINWEMISCLLDILLSTRSIRSACTAVVQAARTPEILLPQDATYLSFAWPTNKMRTSARITQSGCRPSYDCVRALPIAKYCTNLVVGACRLGHDSNRDGRVLDGRRTAEGEGVCRLGLVVVGAPSCLSAKCKEPIGVVTRRHFSPNYPSAPDARAPAIRLPARPMNAKNSR